MTASRIATTLVQAGMWSVLVTCGVLMWRGRKVRDDGPGFWLEARDGGWDR